MLIFPCSFTPACQLGPNPNQGMAEKLVKAGSEIL